MPSFFCLPSEYSSYKDASFAILPVPFEGTVTYKKGTKNGPRKIKEASYEVELYDEELDSEPFEHKITTLPQIKENTPEQVIESVKETMITLLQDKKFPMVLGGEHTITLGEAKALKKFYPRLSVLQIDAHTDLRDDFEGEKLNHATVMKRISELDIPLVQVGIRSMAHEEKTILKDIQTHIIYSRNMKEDWIEEAIEHLTDHVLITIDVDGLDPSIMPSTGTPEPGGLDWYQITDLIRNVCQKKEVVGCDIVELSPIKGIHAPDYLCARLLYKIIGYKTQTNL
ncbi:MAG: agmatinase [Candidatus Woesearchaeota archaeon]